ncbi:alpha/beta-tubulin-N-acetyltransferase 9 [Anopheles nili]|uniref:alpha/beta-tubulin-N-acetyltransferase 9 n=1 Tax=Anopheles nili TaxID=185578 RepID=UPI00237A7598|nr:alpha/beta-tubulin-N-acetyltransferase 9 [Anopheles nili]
MKLNEHLQIIGTKVILVPYESKHVEKYHQWMKSEELQELTASEPLTLDEEYQMQRSWREDQDKCTFLILDRERYEQTKDEIDALVGDTNIFIQPTSVDSPGRQSQDDEREVHSKEPLPSDSSQVGEIEIMIAEPAARRKGYGWQATLLMLLFGVEHLHLNRYIAITKDTNAKAMQMFERMKFTETKRTPVFHEVTFGRSIDDEWTKCMKREAGAYAVVPYPDG